MVSLDSYLSEISNRSSIKKLVLIYLSMYVFVLAYVRACVGLYIYIIYLKDVFSDNQVVLSQRQPKNILSLLSKAKFETEN